MKLNGNIFAVHCVAFGKQSLVKLTPDITTPIFLSLSLERFLKEKADLIRPFTWRPFGGGNRSCIGQRFAISEIKICFAKLLNRFKVEMDPEWSGITFNKGSLASLHYDRIMIKFIDRNNWSKLKDKNIYALNKKIKILISDIILVLCIRVRISCTIKNVNKSNFCFRFHLILIPDLKLKRSFCNYIYNIILFSVYHCRLNALARSVPAA